MCDFLNFNNINMLNDLPSETDKKKLYDEFPSSNQFFRIEKLIYGPLIKVFSNLDYEEITEAQLDQILKHYQILFSDELKRINKFEDRQKLFQLIIRTIIDSIFMAQEFNLDIRRDKMEVIMNYWDKQNQKISKQPIKHQKQ